MATVVLTKDNFEQMLALASIIKKVQELDMAEVHRDIATQEAAETGTPS